MTAAIVNTEASRQTTWIASAAASISIFFADWSSRNAANDDVAHVSDHGAEDIAVTAADPHVNGATAIWAA